MSDLKTLKDLKEPCMIVPCKCCTGTDDNDECPEPVVIYKHLREEAKKLLPKINLNKDYEFLCLCGEWKEVQLHDNEECYIECVNCGDNSLLDIINKRFKHFFNLEDEDER